MGKSFSFSILKCTTSEEQERRLSMEKGVQRFQLVDAVRGLAVANMVIFHALYDVFIIYGKNPTWYSKTPVYLWQQGICWTFIFVSGFTWKWGSKNNLWRGVLLNFYGMVITVVTLLTTPSMPVWFGILNFLGCAILLMLVLQKTLKKIPPVWGMIVSFFLFRLLDRVPLGRMGIGEFIIRLPRQLYNWDILTPMGFPVPEFESGDYFPMIPWFFLYLCGYFFYRIFINKPRWKAAAEYGPPLLSAIGKKSIWIYLLHQPITMLICSLLF